jgi:hypothetical protein
LLLVSAVSCASVLFLGSSSVLEFFSVGIVLLSNLAPERACGVPSSGGVISGLPSASRAKSSNLLLESASSFFSGLSLGSSTVLDFSQWRFCYHPTWPWKHPVRYPPLVEFSHQCYLELPYYRVCFAHTPICYFAFCFSSEAAIFESLVTLPPHGWLRSSVTW